MVPFAGRDVMKKRNRKDILLGVLICTMLCICVGCGGIDHSTTTENGTGLQTKKIELKVFAAASMTETLNEIAERYKEVAPEVTLVFNFDSSGTLKTQIEEGAECDLFISAAPKQINQLEELDLLFEESRVDLLENKVALAVPEGNPKHMNSYQDLVTGLKAGTLVLAMGNGDVPVGQYTQKIFGFFQLNEEELENKGCITYGTNVKEVTTQVSEAVVDCGIIYSTDAYSAGLTVVDTATEEMCGRVVYPAAVLKASEEVDATKEFLDFLTGKEASEIFEKVGFSPLS